MKARWTIAAACAALLLHLAWSCSISPDSDPTITAGAPSIAYVGEAVDVEITGTGLELGASRDVSCGGSPLILDDEFEGSLGEQVLEEVAWIDEGTLTARVPATLAVGLYDLTVTTPAGDSATLVDAFEVRDPGGDSDSDTDIDSDSDNDTDTDGDTDADTDTDTVSDTGTDTDLNCGSGVPLWGICWYLGGVGQSCLEVCADHGGYVDTVPEYVGVTAQGGSLAECGEIFTALGYVDPVIEGTRDDGLGLGCHRWGDGVLWWLTDPAFDAADSTSPARIACGCVGDGG